MGQEASVPLDGEAQSLEAQARAPPTAVVTTGAPMSPRSSGKRKGGGGGMHHTLSGLFPSSSLTRKEAAVAMNPDSILLGDESQSSQRHLDALQKIPVSQEVNGGMTNSMQQQYQYPPEHSASASHAELPTQSATTPSKSKLQLSGRARGMISSMRHLSLGITSRKPKEANSSNTDWEKQWDDDEDDSEEEEEDDDGGEPNLTAIPLSAGPLHAMTTELKAEDDEDDDEEERHIIPPDEADLEIPPELQKPDVQMFMPVLRVLGKGSFGKVVLVQKRQGKERGQLFAMKILKKTHLVKRRQIERTRTERKVLSVVNHPFIMKLHYAFQTPEKLYLVLDYCPGGELFFHLSRFRRFPERVARFYAAELLLAMGHLHKRGIIYRDLKPENVLLDAEGHVKLGDFGLAKAGISHPYEGATSMCGTPEYMAPEVLGQLGHGFCVDYWGLGMIVYEMMTGLPPWYTTDRSQLFRRLKSAPLEIPPYFSDASADCVAALLERNPRRRLGVTGIRTAMEHPFFRNISWRALYSRRMEAPVQPCEGWKPPEALSGASAELTDAPASSLSFAPQYQQQDGIVKLDAHMLDTATQNFDAQFTRMAVESEDPGGGPEDEGCSYEDDLNDETFLGFTFDVEREKAHQLLLAQTGSGEEALAARHRTQNYHAPFLDGKEPT